MLVVVCGLPGTGKSTVSKELTKELKARVLSTDEIRKGVLKEPGYTKKKKKRVYEEMFRMAEDLLKINETVILDATFFRKEWRAKAHDTAKKRDENIFFIKVICPEEVVKRRIEKRYGSDADYSDANYHVYKIIQAKFEPVERDHFVIETGKDEDWRKKTLDLANKMRIVEKQEKVINRLKNKYKMRLLQTHISWVLLDGQHAFKIKKPVRFSFVDYSSLKKRKRFCEMENEINSLLSPELYLGVTPVKSKGGSIGLNQKGKTLEYAVKMVELPQRARMDNLIRTSDVNRGHIKKIARILAEFHDMALNAPKKYGSAKIIRENFSPIFETKPVIEKYFQYGGNLEKIKNRVEDFVKKNRGLFSQRVEEEKIKRCHGDVRTKNIFICRDKIFIFDAVEFSKKIACCDVCAEIAFLAMDLNFYGKERWAYDLVNDYIEFSGDKTIIKLIDFYICYRALVESLVETYTIEDPEVGEKK
jgi:aminoglycoside phosphotransferase family enzyme/predicted kinase